MGGLVGIHTNVSPPTSKGRFGSVVLVMGSAAAPPSAPVKVCIWISASVVLLARLLSQADL